MYTSLCCARLKLNQMKLLYKCIYNIAVLTFGLENARSNYCTMTVTIAFGCTLYMLRIDGEHYHTTFVK